MTTKRVRVGTKVTVRMPNRQRVIATVGPDRDLDRHPITLKSGRRITEADVPALVSEIHRRAGRPSLKGTTQGRRSPVLHVCLPQGLYDRVVAKARRRGQTPSEYVRERLR